MPARLVALDEGPDIPLDRAMVVVGRHPQCDARLDSLRVSRHHCCMTQDQGEVVVRDLGSTNGIRINGQRVEVGRLRPGDELSIAHIRYRLDNGQGHEPTLADGPRDVRERRASRRRPRLGPDGRRRSARRARWRPSAGRRCRARTAGGRRPRAPAGGPGRPLPDPGHRPDARERGGRPAGRPADGPGPGAENLDACRPDSSP